MTRAVWGEIEYCLGRRIGRPLGFLGRFDGTFDREREVLDQHAADSRRYHCCDTDHSQPFFSPGRLLGLADPAYLSAHLLSGVVYLLRDPGAEEEGMIGWWNAIPERQGNIA